MTEAADATREPATDPSSEEPILWEIRSGPCPVVATAIHAGHGLRSDVARALELPEDVRLREEDPATDRFAIAGCTQVTVRHSRFEVDLNRPREGAVYSGPDEAWGLDPWGGEPPAEVEAESLEEYDAFYASMESLLGQMEERWGRFVVLDLHSYNWRREGPDDPGDPVANPEMNVGTGGLDRERWRPVIDRFMADLAREGLFGRSLDVRENVRFRGGHFPRWVAATFPESACPLAIEVRKIYMDEWTGELHEAVVREIGRALDAVVPGLVEALGEVA